MLVLQIGAELIVDLGVGGNTRLRVPAGVGWSSAGMRDMRRGLG